MEGLKLIPYLALIICISGVIIGAAAITVNKFATNGISDKCTHANLTLQTDGKSCKNTTVVIAISHPAGGIDGLNLSDASYNAMKSQEGIQTIGGQIPTVAIIAVMVIIISVIAGVFVYMRMFA